MNQENWSILFWLTTVKIYNKYHFDDDCQSYQRCKFYPDNLVELLADLVDR